MSEYLERLGMRCKSDIMRGVRFDQGMAHFVEYVIQVMREIDEKLERMEKLAQAEGKK